MAESLNALIALIALADLKEQVKISGSGEDTHLNRAINKAGGYCKNFSGRNFVQKIRTEYYDGEGDRELILKNVPISSITSIHSDTLRVFGSGTEITSANYMLRKESGIIELWNNESFFPTGRGNIKVVSVAGYLVGTDVPDDLQEANLLIAQHFYKSFFQKQRIDIQSETVGDRSISYREADIPKKAKDILKKYRVIRTSSRVFE